MAAKKNEFASLALKWRERHNLTRVEAAEKLNVPYRTLEDWEAGRRKPRSILHDMLTKKFNHVLAGPMNPAKIIRGPDIGIEKLKRKPPKTKAQPAGPTAAPAAAGPPKKAPPGTTS
jgi:DNA-binding XRE family transcriptional regulator